MINCLLRFQVALVVFHAFTVSSCAHRTQNSENKLIVFETGTIGAPIVLVEGGPGLPGSLETLATYIKPHRSLRFDQRDSLRAPKFGSFGLQDYVQDIEIVVDRAYQAFKIKPILLGHSYGAKLITEYLKKYPTKVQKVILVAPGSYLASTRKAIVTASNEYLKKYNPIALQQIDANTKLMQSTHLEDRLRGNRDNWNLTLPAYFFDGKVNPELRFYDADPKKFSVLARDISEKMERNELQLGLDQILVPVVHIHGTRDIIPFQETKALFERSFRNYKFIEISGAGHFPWLEKAHREEFMTALKKELKID